VMMPVMNTAYGIAEKLPFDMGHLRHPIRYELPAAAKNAERRAVRKALTEEFEAILRLMVAARGEAKQTSLFQEAKASFSPAFFFPSGAVIAEFGHPGEQQYRFEGDKAIYLRLFPKSSEQPRVGRALLKAIVQNRRALNPMAAATTGGVAAPNDHGYIAIEPSGSNTAQAISQGFPTGEIWGINSNVFRSVALQHVTGEEKSIFFGAIGVEKAYTRTLENYASAALTEMKLRPPYMVEIGAIGLKGVYMGAPHPEFSSGNYYGPIRDETLIRRFELQGVTRAELDDVLRQFFNELYDIAECSRPEVLTDEHTRRNDLPQRS
jgi:hypothetical protein